VNAGLCWQSLALQMLAQRRLQWSTGREDQPHWL